MMVELGYWWGLRFGHVTQDSCLDEMDGCDFGIEYVPQKDHLEELSEMDVEYCW